MSLKKQLNQTAVVSNSKRKRSLEYEIRKACLNGNTEIAIEYLSESEVLNIDELNRTEVLFHAIKSGDLMLVKRLLEVGCNVNIKNKSCCSALYMALHEEKFQIAELLAKNGAIYFGNICISECLYELLEEASFSGYFHLCKIALENGASVNNSNEQIPPLHFAAEMGHVDVVELLIRNGANVNFLDKESQTPFHCAAIKKHADVVKRFFELGTNLDLNIRNDYGKTASEETFGSRKRFENIGKLMIYQNHIKN